eukprot:g3416.t1
MIRFFSTKPSVQFKTNLKTHIKREQRRVKRMERSKRLNPNQEEEHLLKTITLVGRPNVGKSRLFNRFVGRRVAIVNDKPGTTRDFRESIGSLSDLSFKIVDTAGLEETSISLEEEMLFLTKEAICKSNLILFLIDAQDGVTAVDEHFAKWLRKEAVCKTFVVVNKIDNILDDDAIIHSVNAECLKLGFGHPIFISGEHGHGLSDLYLDLLDELEEKKKEDTMSTTETNDGNDSMVKDNMMDAGVKPPLQLAIVGKPNVGKSTLLNQLLDSQRVLTGPMAGVTRDPIRIDMEHPTDPTSCIRLIDTAGIRRMLKIPKRNTETSIERWAALETSHAIKHAHVAVLVMDSTLPPTKDDKALIGQICEEGRGLVILANKCDLMENNMMDGQVITYEWIQESVEDIIYIVPISALDGKNTNIILDNVLDVYEKWNTYIKTGILNRWIQEIQRTRPIPGGGKIKYCTQISSRPPSFVFFSNKNPKTIPTHYVRFLINLLKEEFDMNGIPIRVNIKGRPGKGD